MDYSNIGTMLSQLKGQAAYTEQNTASVTGKQMQAVETLLKNLEPGQIFSGEITDIRGAYITITLQNMQSVQARLAENFEFLIGQKALFQVKDNQDNQLLIRPLVFDAAQSGELMVAGRALEAAGIQMTEKTLELVKNLMAANQPIDKQSILSYVRQLAKFPQAEISDLISLHKYQIPVNEENIDQLSNYKQFEHSLLNDFDTVEQKLPQIVEQMSAEAPDRAEAFLKELVNILYPEEAAAETKNVTGEQASILQQDAASETDSVQAVMEAQTEERLHVSGKENEQDVDVIKTNDTVKLSEQLKELSSHLTGKDWKEDAGKLIRNAL